MKKGIATLSILIMSMFIAFSANGADYSQADNVVTVSAANVTGADNIEFQASAQVNIDGVSEETAFAHAASHSQVVGKKNGRQFGMASDNSSIWWLEIETTAVYDVAATTSAQFSNNGFIKL